MNNDFRTLFANATDEFLRRWTDPKMVDRAYGYLDKIGRVAYAEGYGCITLVYGTDDYYTRVFIGEDGGLESRCSCPVGHRCKHAVATILTIAKVLREGAGITENAGDCDILKSADRAFAAREAIFEERERKLRERRLAKEKEEAEYRAALEKRRCEALALYGGFLTKIEDLYRRGDHEGVLAVLDEACASTDDSFDIEPFGGELYDLVEEMSRIALKSLEGCGMGDAEKILYVHDAGISYRYYVSPFFLHEAYWGEGNAEKFGREVWSAVGEKIADRLGRIPKDEMSYHETLYDVHGARDAFERAGRHGDAADVCARYCDETCEWAAAAVLSSTHNYPYLV